MIEIGSSEAPVVMGCSPFSTPWQLWATKVGLLERKDEPDEVMRWGTRLEEPVLDALAVEYGWPTYLYQDTRHSPSRPWQRATCDAIVPDAEGVASILVELKCVIGQPPPVPRVDWLVQCLHEQLVVPEATKHLLVAFGGLRTEAWWLPYHRKALDRVLREEERFLELVETETPPPVRAADASPLNRAWPLVAERVVSLGPEAAEWDRTLMIAKVAEKHWREMREHMEANLKLAMGDAARAVLPDGTRFSWLAQTRKESVIPAGTTRVLRRKGE